ncbi:MAG TPA: BrnT family toxin [Candidatus Kapabacteria bacterium]|nr:BrnT family toxin [Candidatus Kapabacteria bacterium]
MMEQFEWHNEKNELNQKKHNISFQEAITIFEDPLAIYKPDTEHSDFEERSYIIGKSNKNKLIVVSFTERQNNIRIITARLATKKEIRNYENQI